MGSPEEKASVCSNLKGQGRNLTQVQARPVCHVRDLNSRDEGTGLGAACADYLGTDTCASLIRK